MKRVALTVLALLWCSGIWAQDRNDAVIYIQSDKETPIYVKMEGQMMERYSKNYVILNGLASGPMNIEVLFQQNQYPAQQFVLNVPPSGQRSFVLQKIDERKFALYDLNYGIYLQAGNKFEDDIDLSRMPVANNDIVPEIPIEPAASQEEAVPAFNNKSADAQEDRAARRLKKEQERQAREQEAALAQEIPKEKKEKTLEQIIDDAPKLSRAERRRMETEQQRSEEQGRFLDFEMDKKEKETNIGNKRTASGRSSATTCEEAASEEQFNSFAGLVNIFDDEEQRLAAIRKNGSKYCFSTEQVRTVAMGFESQSSRYEVARSLKPYVVDKDQFAKLSVLFNTNYLKERFLNEVVK